MADPTPEIKSIGIRNLARSAFGWPARILFPPVCAGCRRHVGGCDDLHELEAEGRLDRLLANGATI